METLEIRLFNRLEKYAPNGSTRFSLATNDSLSFEQLLNRLNIPLNEVFLAMRNGRNIELFSSDDVLSDGDVIALSGPVPYSKGYGSPVV